MSLLDKIKEFFKEEKPQETKKKELNILELENWLKERDKEVEIQLKKETQNLHSQLSINLEKLETELKILESVNLQERKEHERIKQITELGKIEYINAVRKLIESLNQKSPPPYINNEINKFAISSQKSHFKATHLIGKEIEDIMNTISLIRKLENDFLKVNETILKEQTTIENLINRIKERQMLLENRNTIIKEKENTEKYSQEIKKEIGKLEIKIEEIIKSPEAQKREKLIIEKEKKEEELKIQELNIKNIIDRRVLEKYSHLNKNRYTKIEKEMQNYMEDPIPALLSDNNLIIKSILEECIKEIKMGSINIKDSDKIISKLSLGKDSLPEHKKSIKTIRKEIQSIEAKISNIQLATSSIQNEKLQKEIKLEENKGHFDILSKKEEKLQNKIKEINLQINDNLQRFNILLN